MTGFIYWTRTNLKKLGISYWTWTDFVLDWAWIEEMNEKRRDVSREV